MVGQVVYREIIKCTYMYGLFSKHITIVKEVKKANIRRENAFAITALTVKVRSVHK